MDNQQNKPTRPRRQRVLRNGIHVLQKRPDAAANAKTHKIFPVHGGAARVLRRGVLDTRGALGKSYTTEITGLTAHIGGDPNVPQGRLVEQGARLHLLEAMAWAEVQAATGLIRPDGTVNPALDALLRVMRERREVLKLLGLHRHQKPAPTLQEFLAAHTDDPDPEEPQE